MNTKVPDFEDLLEHGACFRAGIVPDVEITTPHNANEIMLGHHIGDISKIRLLCLEFMVIRG